jgi:hypothetical protein
MAKLREFKLKSGATLQVQPAEFEKGVALVEAVGRAVLGKDEGLQFDQVALFDEGVRRAVYAVFPWVLYETQQMSLDLFKDPKIGDRLAGDWFEIAGRVIEVNREYFFPRASSESSASEEASTEGRRSRSASARP